jgi:hypothetical protein
MPTQAAIALQATNGFAVTPHNTNTFKTSTSGVYEFATLYVGGTGDVTLLTVDGTVLTFVGVPAGTFLPVIAQRVNSTGTTATSIVGLVGRFGA